MKFKIFVSVSIAVIIAIIIYLFFYLINKHDKREHLTVFGNVDIRQVDLGFRVFGKVSSLFFEEGDRVKPGDLLALMESTPYEEEKEIAQAKVMELENSFKKAEARFKKRYLTDPDAISKENYDDAFYSLEEMKAGLEQAKATLARALTNLDDTKLYSPTEGSILTRIREPGSVLQPGEPVFTISEAQPVWIRAYVTEPELGNIYFGMDATVITDTRGMQSFKGKVGFISPVAEFTPKTVQSLDLRTDLVYRIRVYVDDPRGDLKQGMPVTVKLKIAH
jgi:HlyD family secretion protein